VWLIATSPSHSGTVVKVDGTNLILTVPQPAGEAAKEVTVATDEQTRITLGSQTGKLEDLQPGMRARVIPDTGTARQILMRPPPAAAAGAGASIQPTSRLRGVMGTLIRIDGTNLIIRPGIGRADEVTIPTDANTSFTVDYDSGKTLDDLKPEMTISVTQIPALRSEPARLAVMATSKTLDGVVTEVAGTKLTLQVKTLPGKTTTVAVDTDEKTRIIFMARTVGGAFNVPNEPAVADLKIGMAVKVLPETGTAQKILVSPVMQTKPGL
jgi:hypothetical protein